MKVLRTPDGSWRAELRSDGWWLFHLGAVIISRAPLDGVVLAMIEQGGNPDEMVED